MSTRAAENAKAEEAAVQAETVPEVQPPCDRVVIDVLPNSAHWPSNDVGSIPSPLTSDSSSASSSRGYAYNTPRPLRVIDPTVTFRSASALTAHSSFRILYNGAVVHTEDTPLELRSSSCMPAAQFSSEMDCSYLYSTTLVPRFWRKLCDSSGTYNDLSHRYRVFAHLSSTLRPFRLHRCARHHANRGIFLFHIELPLPLTN